MLRYFLAVLLMLGALGDVSQPALLIAPSTPVVQTLLYFPLVSKSGVKVVITRFDAYPTYNYYVLGYLDNQSTDPVSVTLEADITVYPYSIETPVPPYTTTVQFRPALTATLPGQLNPFKIDAWCYKSCDLITGIHVLKASPLPTDQGKYYPLTIPHWEYTNGALSGTLQNDNSQTMKNVRVVVYEPAKCYWTEATLQASSLEPGKQTSFSIRQYPAGCVSSDLTLVGQGQAPAQ